MTDIDIEFDRATLEPRALARLVKTTPPGRLQHAIGGPQRGMILDTVFEGMPAVFQPAKAGGLRAVLHWCVGDRPGGGTDTYELVIADGTCTLSSRPDREPNLTMSIGGLDFLRMVTGNVNPMKLFLTGRLKARGDLGLAMRVPHLFVPPAA